MMLLNVVMEFTARKVVGGEIGCVSHSCRWYLEGMIHKEEGVEVAVEDEDVEEEEEMVWRME
jgi:hypothetical protein